MVPEVHRRILRGYGAAPAREPTPVQTPPKPDVGAILSFVRHEDASAAAP